MIMMRLEKHKRKIFHTAGKKIMSILELIQRNLIIEKKFLYYFQRILEIKEFLDGLEWAKQTQKATEKSQLEDEKL